LSTFASVFESRKKSFGKMVLLQWRKRTMKPPTIKESQRSEEVREGLREQGFKVLWDVREELTRVSYWHNGAGKALLLLEHAHDLKWESWDLYRPLTTSNKIGDTYAALGEYVKGIEVEA
jgi:hypothetical protein